MRWASVRPREVVMCPGSLRLLASPAAAAVLSSAGSSGTSYPEQIHCDSCELQDSPRLGTQHPLCRILPRRAEGLKYPALSHSQGSPTLGNHPVPALRKVEN